MGTSWFCRQASKLSWVKPFLIAIASSGSSGFCTTQSFCCEKNASISGKYLSLPAQRASMAAAAASASSGNSRKMKRTFPVSMYFFFISG